VSVAARPRKSRPLRSDAERNRSRILHVARKAVAAGEVAPAWNELARRAGVGVGTVYRAFADLPALFEALAEASFRELERAAHAALAEPDPARGLDQLIDAIVVIVLADPSVCIVLSSVVTSHRGAAALAQIVAPVTALLANARRAGALRADIELDDLRRLVCGLEHAVRVGGDREASAGRYAAILRAGLRPLEASAARARSRRSRA